VSAVEFQAWPKIPRLNRGILVTEKLDGTNACVVILPLGDTPAAVGARETVDWLGDRVLFDRDRANAIALVGDYAVFAQSRSRFVIPGRDNYGFAEYVRQHAEALVATLGPGRHFGEWYGAGIQRRYGLQEKRLALFNVDRWKDVDLTDVPRLEVVPELYRGPFDQGAIDQTVDELERYGSTAVRGFDRPEGVVVWHYASRTSYKVTVEDDEAPKGPAAHARDEQP
jgi:hypothetical protein